MSLLFNMLSRLVIAFLPRSKCLLISWLQSPSAVILEPPKIKSVTVSIYSPSICHQVMGLDAMILAFWMLNFKITFYSPLSLSSRGWWNGNSERLYFGGSKITADGDCSLEIKRCLLPGRKAMTNLDSILKSRHYFADKALSNQSYGFSSSHVWVLELDHKEGWALKNWWFWTVVLERTLESPLDCKEIKLVNIKGNLKEIVLRIFRIPWCWSWSSNTLATWCEEMTHWKIPWCWERLRAGREGGDRKWDG